MMLENFRKNFIFNFRDALIKKYGKVPPSSFIANEFNQISPDSPPLSSETVRRWLTGVSLPEIHRLAILCKALNVHPEHFIKLDHINTNSQNHPK